MTEAATRSFFSVSPSQSLSLRGLPKTKVTNDRRNEQVIGDTTVKSRPAKAAPLVFRPCGGAAPHNYLVRACVATSIMLQRRSGLSHLSTVLLTCGLVLMAAMSMLPPSRLELFGGLLVYGGTDPDSGYPAPIFRGPFEVAVFLASCAWLTLVSLPPMSAHASSRLPRLLLSAHTRLCPACCIDLRISQGGSC